MKEKGKKTTRILIKILVLIIPLTISSCDLLKGEELVSYGRNTYSIDPDTILSDIDDQYNTDFFTPQNDISIKIITPYVQWEISDYFEIGKLLHKKVWNEDLSNWELSLINFRWVCGNIESGPQDAHLGYVKLIKLEGDTKTTKYKSSLSILPRRNIVSGKKEVYYPLVYPYKTISHLDNPSNTISQILDIAEKNGGTSIRSSVNNACDINVLLNPNSVGYSGWQVAYRDETGGELVEFFIDPETLEIDKIFD